MKLNYSQVRDALNMRSINGAKSRILKYKKELKEYIYKDKNGKIVGFDDSGIEALRNIGRKNSNTKSELKQIQLDNAYNEIRMKDEMIELLKNENSEFKAKLERLEAENDAMSKSLGIFGLMRYNRLIEMKNKKK